MEKFFIFLVSVDRHSDNLSIKYKYMNFIVYEWL